MESSPNNNPSSAAATAALSPAASLSSPSSPPPSGRPLARTGSPPWTQIVRGPESDTGADILPVEIPLESGDNSNAGGSKKPATASAWNKPPPVANGSVDNSGVNSPTVMGAASWPALSESAKASPKSDSSKNIADSGSPAPVPAPSIQVTGLAASSSSSPLPSPSQSTSQKPTTSSVNHGRPVRQKSMKRDGGGNAQANGCFSHQSGEGSINHNSTVKASSSGVNNDLSGRDNVQNHSNRDSGPRNAGGDHHHQPRNSFRRGNGGPHSRGDGSHQHYGGRRGDHDRGIHEWNHQRSFNGRDAPPPPMQSRVGPRGFVRNPPTVTAPFVHPVVGPAPMRPPYMNPLVPPDALIYFPPTMSYVPPPPPPPPLHPSIFFHESQLLPQIQTQIEYYFSNENLIKDTFLRKKMNPNGGWVHISLIAGFKKVMQLTDDHELILKALRESTLIETQGDMIRRKGDWMRWIMPPSLSFPTTPSLQSPEPPNVATISTDIHSVSLNDRIPDLSRSSSGNLSNPIRDGATSSGF